MTTIAMTRLIPERKNTVKKFTVTSSMEEKIKKPNHTFMNDIRKGFSLLWPEKPIPDSPPDSREIIW